MSERDESMLLSDWVDSLWTASCPHGGAYARDCTRCVHETLYRSPWLTAHDTVVRAVERKATGERIAAIPIKAEVNSFARGYNDGVRDAFRIARADTGAVES